MRVADKMQFEQVKTNIGKNRSQMADLQNQAATQKRVNKPSDDPMAVTRVLSTRVDLQGNKQFTASLGLAKGFLEMTDQSLSELGEILVRTKELALSQANDGSASKDSRRAVAMEMEQLHNEIVAIGNRKIGDRFIFAGYNTQAAPFDSEGHYTGDKGQMMIHVDKESFVPMNIPGSQVFLGSGVSNDGMIKSPPQQLKTIEEFEHQRQQTQDMERAEMRGPASINATTQEESESGINLFHLMKGLGIALSVNDKEGVQDSLETLDAALQQVVLTRAQVGARSNVIDNFATSMEKQKLENKISISSLEDADVYATVSDINKAQATLQATLETSGKMIQPSLMQFLR